MADSAEKRAGDSTLGLEFNHAANDKLPCTRFSEVCFYDYQVITSGLVS